MNKKLKRILPILLGIVIIFSVVWYLFVYDRDFTRDVLLDQARRYEEKGDNNTAAWLYDLAYSQSGGDENVAIELAEHFKQSGNYTQAEVTLSKAIADGGSYRLYIELCKTYVEQDKLLDAVTMLDNIADETVRQELAAKRPAAPQPDYAPGYYNQYITVSISGEGGKLYIAKDGQYPSTADGPSGGSITLSGGENTVYALTVGDNGLVSPLSILGYTVSGVIEEVSFTDEKLDAAVRQALGFDADAALYSSDLWTITKLTLSDGAYSYTELSRLPYLQSLTIENGSAGSLEGIGSLNALTELVIRDTYVGTTDLLILASLPNLRQLTLEGCSISSIDNLSGCQNLEYLDLSDNSIRDFTALSFMTGLTQLDLSHNALTSLNAVSGLTNLQSLNVANNALTSIAPVAGCTQLKYLTVSNNTIATLNGVENLAQLEYLDASGNALTSVAQLSTCTALTRLDISSNSLTDISHLQSLTKLQFFYFSRNSVSVLPDWGKSCALVTIDGSYNQITSIAPLSGYENLNTVLMDYNKISWVDGLASCYNLIKVSVYGNPVTDVSALTAQSIIVIYNPIG